MRHFGTPEGKPGRHDEQPHLLGSCHQGSHFATCEALPLASLKPAPWTSDGGGSGGAPISRAFEMRACTCRASGRAKGDAVTQSATSSAISVGIAAKPGSEGARPRPLASVSVDVCHVRELDMMRRIDLVGHAMRVSSMPNA